MTEHGEQLDEREVNGRRFWYRPGSVDEVILAEVYQQMRFTLPKLEAEAAPIVVDAGAHIGSFAVLVAACLHNATVYALEPAKSNFDLLTRNIPANGLSNVVPLRVALSYSDGVAPLYHAAENWGHSLHQDLADADEPVEDVTITTLDGFMRSNGISTNDCLKMNIEGAEYDVLFRSSRETPSAIRRMEVEFHPFPIAGGDQLASWLSWCGLDVETTCSTEEAGKGWIRTTRRDHSPQQDHHASL